MLFHKTPLTETDQAFLNELIKTNEPTPARPKPKPKPFVPMDVEPVSLSDADLADLKTLHGVLYGVSLTPSDVGATGHIEEVKKPAFVPKPHLTHTLRTHEGLQALRKQQQEEMHEARGQSKRNHPSNQNRR